MLSRRKANVFVRFCVLLRLTLTLTQQRKVTGLPVSTMLLGSTSRPTSLMVDPAEAESSKREVRRSHNAAAATATGRSGLSHSCGCKSAAGREAIMSQSSVLSALRGR